MTDKTPYVDPRSERTLSRAGVDPMTIQAQDASITRHDDPAAGLGDKGSASIKKGQGVGSR